ncbi:MAG TPA: alpha/beta hydrolase [Steroidobacteraceae bacterium]|nr:alpha/beta hydrolase [Steroidobacteraceae bacterium]
MLKSLSIALGLGLALTLSKAAPAADPAPPAPTEQAGIPGTGAQGSWLGTLKAGAFSLRLALEVTESDGKLSAVLDSIDQNAKIPVTSIESTTDGMKFAIAMINGAFTGKYSANGAEVAGTWTQNGNAMPLTFKRRASAFALKRPQEPVKPYPYREEQVSFANPKANGVTLAGTLTLPEGKGPFPAVVLMTGSGPQDRDEALMGHKPFLVLADHLTRAGIAVLRYDDRGIGASKGNYATATHFDFASDGNAAFNFLKTRAEVDARRIGLLGHSEGSVYAPYITKDSSDVAFVVLLAGVGVPTRQLLERQGKDIVKAMGFDHTPSAAEIAINDAVYARLALKKIDAETIEFLRAKMREAVALTPENIRQALGLNDQYVESQLQVIMTPWFMELATYDATKELRNIHCPVLALFGDKDMQVAAQPNSAAMKSTFAAAKNRDVTLQTFPGLNHLFQHAKTGAPSEYGAIEETMSPEVMNATAQWILARRGGR